MVYKWCFYEHYYVSDVWIRIGSSWLVLPQVRERRWLSVSLCLPNCSSQPTWASELWSSLQPESWPARYTHTRTHTGYLLRYMRMFFSEKNKKSVMKLSVCLFKFHLMIIWKMNTWAYLILRKITWYILRPLCHFYWIVCRLTESCFACQREWDLGFTS